jgi:hypothetical protein
VHIDEMPRMAEEVRELLGSLEPLDNPSIHGCDLHIFLYTFLGDLGFNGLKPPIVFPQIKELAILHPLMDIDDVECLGAVVELAKSQHVLGIPFERVTVCMGSIPLGMAEELKRWVGAVDCCEEWCEDI